jgi:flavorubredoxin
MGKEIADGIFWVGVNDFESELFEELWPLPHGISYNAYLILDEKTALIDTVKKNHFDELLKKIQPLLQNGRKIDYLVINHIEPDHSGAIEFLTRLFPAMCIVGNEKTMGLLQGFYRAPNPVLVVKDKDTLALGGHTLEFHLTPMVHWPETMLTYEQKTQTIFTGDVLGGFGALEGDIFDDKVDYDFYIQETRRYFTNVIGKYAVPVQKALERMAQLPLKRIATTHGPVYRTDLKRIVDLYSSWSRYETEKGVVVVYASMYDHTKLMAETIAQQLAENGVDKIKLFNVSHTHISFIINEIWRFRGLILGSCTYNTRLFPLMESLIHILENDRLQNHLLGFFGSYSWSGGALTALKSFGEKSGLKVVEPFVEAQCAPSEEVLEQCRTLAKNFAQGLETA